MKYIPIIALLFLGNGLLAADLAVFGEKDVFTLDGSAAASGPKEAGRMAFVDAVRTDLRARTSFEEALELISPPQWGKTVGAATRGRIQFHPSFPGGFVGRIALDSLLPDHDYILTLNGNPAKDGNGLLPSEVPGNPTERYYDFLIIRTDARGHYDAGLGIFLKPGNYDVRCYVKDTGDFKIVLYRDFFKFAVR